MKASMTKSTLFGLVRCLSLFVVLSFSWANSGSAQSEESRVAWLIGNEDYASMPLANPINDIQLVGDSLEAIGFSVIRSLNLSDWEEFRSKRNEVVKRLESDSVGVFLFYYAGHAIQVISESRSRNYLIPTGVELEAPEQARRLCIDLELDVIEAFSLIEGCAMVVVLDACRVNPYEAKRYRSGAIGSGLGAISDPPLGSLIAFSTTAGSTAVDGSGVNTPYARAFASKVKTPNTELSIVFQDIRREVLKATNRQQQPQEYNNLTQSLMLVPKPAYMIELSEVVEAQLNDLRDAGKNWPEFVATIPRRIVLVEDVLAQNSDGLDYEGLRELEEVRMALYVLLDMSDRLNLELVDRIRLSDLMRSSVERLHLQSDDFTRIQDPNLAHLLSAHVDLMMIESDVFGNDDVLTQNEYDSLMFAREQAVASFADRFNAELCGVVWRSNISGWGFDRSLWSRNSLAPVQFDADIFGECFSGGEALFWSIQLSSAIAEYVAVTERVWAEQVFETALAFNQQQCLAWIENMLVVKGVVDQFRDGSVGVFSKLAGVAKMAGAEDDRVLKLVVQEDSVRAQLFAPLDLDYIPDQDLNLMLAEWTMAYHESFRLCGELDSRRRPAHKERELEFRQDSRRLFQQALFYGFAEVLELVDDYEDLGESFDLCAELDYLLDDLVSVRRHASVDNDWRRLLVTLDKMSLKIDSLRGSSGCNDELLWKMFALKQEALLRLDGGWMSGAHIGLLLSQAQIKADPLIAYSIIDYWRRLAEFDVDAYNTFAGRFEVESMWSNYGEEQYYVSLYAVRLALIELLSSSDAEVRRIGSIGFVDYWAHVLLRNDFVGRLEEGDWYLDFELYLWAASCLTELKAGGSVPDLNKAQIDWCVEFDWRKDYYVGFEDEFVAVIGSDDTRDIYHVPSVVAVLAEVASARPGVFEVCWSAIERGCGNDKRREELRIKANFVCELVSVLRSRNVSCKESVPNELYWIAERVLTELEVVEYAIERNLDGAQILVESCLGIVADPLLHDRLLLLGQ